VAKAVNRQRLLEAKVPVKVAAESPGLNDSRESVVGPGGVGRESRGQLRPGKGRAEAKGVDVGRGLESKVRAELGGFDVGVVGGDRLNILRLALAIL
jgi:hypothetical protein